MRRLAMKGLVLERGAHSPDGKFCVMEAVAYVAGEEWSDSPECVSPVIATFLRVWNDELNDTDRQMLKPYIKRVIGTNTGRRDDDKRAWLATDWLARECAPAWLRLAGLTSHAETLEALAPLTTAARARKAQPSLDAARSAAGSAARSAAEGAAGSAAWSAAVSAAWSAARSAAVNAARSAAWSAAVIAAWSAAVIAAESALQPTTKELQKSALLLADRMVAVGKKA